MAKKNFKYTYYILHEHTTLCTCSPLWSHVSLPYWVTPYKLGDGEPAPNERLKELDEVHQKSVLHLLMCGGLCSWRWVQDVLGGVVVHHKGVVMGGLQIVGTPYHGGVLLLKYGF